MGTNVKSAKQVVRCVPTAEPNRGEPIDLEMGYEFGDIPDDFRDLEYTQRIKEGEASE